MIYYIFYHQIDIKSIVVLIVVFFSLSLSDDSNYSRTISISMMKKQEAEAFSIFERAEWRSVCVCARALF